VRPVDGATTGVIERWRAVAEQRPGAPVELAAPFQRHYTQRGTGLPPNFCLVVTESEVIALKFDPRHASHPLEVNPNQLGKEVARWPRSSVRIGDLSEGRLAIGAVLRVDDRAIPCRTPKMGGNPAAHAVIAALGGGAESSR
jgi:hypothetical protein